MIVMQGMDSEAAKLTRETRKVCRLTQSAFGRLLGVDHARVSKWERGTYAPSAATIKLLQIILADPATVLGLLEGLVKESPPTPQLPPD